MILLIATTITASIILGLIWLMKRGRSLVKCTCAHCGQRDRNWTLVAVRPAMVWAHHCGVTHD